MKKRFLSLALFLTLLSSLLLTPVSAASQFRDVSETDWFYEAVNEAAKIGIVNGTGDGMFSPNQQLTTLQFITMMTRLAYGSEIDETLAEALTEDSYDNLWLDYTCPGASFENWWTIYVYYAYHDMTDYMKLSEDEIEDLFMGKDRPCTRDMMAACIEWFLTEEENTEFDVHNAAYAIEKQNTGFVPDIDSCTYKSSVALAVAAGIINGIDESRTFDPNGIMTRGQACQVIYKLLNKDKRTPVTTDDIKQFVIEQSAGQLPAEVRSLFNKTADELGVDFTVSIDDLNGIANNPLLDLNYYMSDSSGTVVGSFDANIHYLSLLEYKIDEATDYKVISDHLFATVCSSSVSTYDEKNGGFMKETTNYIGYYVFAISGNTLYMQRVADPIHDYPARAVEVASIISSEKAQEMKLGTFVLSDAIGTWDCTSFYSAKPESSLVIDGSNSIILHGKTFACKALGNDQFEFSANGKKATYTMWLSKTLASDPSQSIKMVCFRYDSDSLAGDITGVFTEKNKNTFLFGDNGYTTVYYEIRDIEE